MLSCVFFTVPSITGCNQLDPPQTEIPEDLTVPFTVTIFTDVHHADKDKNVEWNCSKATTKLQKILSDTPNSAFYISLGDAVDSLPKNSTIFYDELADLYKQNNLNIFNLDGKNYVDGNRMIYNLMGNHEAGHVAKSLLANYIPYRENIGSAFSWKYKGVLFVAIDACYDSKDMSDSIESLVSGPKSFGIPQAQFDFIKQELDTKINSNVKSIVWLSHIAYKDIEESTRNKLANLMTNYNLPVTIFEGHTHISNTYKVFDETVQTKTKLNVYTLPPVTNDFTKLYNSDDRNLSCPYYNVTFKNGLISKVDRVTNNKIAK